MANRRLLDRRIICGAAMERLPILARMLYWYLIFDADDDGFVGNPQRVIRMAGASDEHYEMLLEAGFILDFPSGVCVISHWFCHNVKTREGYMPTVFTAELSQLRITDRGEYEIR